MKKHDLNTTGKLRKAVSALPDDSTIGMVLGLDGDCDFSYRVTDYYAYACGKQELLELIDAQPEGGLPFMFQNRDYLVLSRRHAVYLPDVLTVRIPTLAM